ncbi:lysophospholipid acyltransferase family protein [Stigmatella sp. ncwal1]|uniref:Lysophospholipid acyltransferase family protein n=1 Tax=Stigmatella ashevillensis TaxID=2995309 RepID=A0ABT5D9P5_9BACT|nr:lysophospholipid acyltransferase family protein [Stigmatella ashevillena]MDC0709764.1 lysophospholipid acyltransferase family protein [Stigmatella ashevillena]
MFYAFIRGLVSLALRLFYRVKVQAPATEFEGPLIFVGNHPNSLIDPALVFILTRRPVTFLAKEPLFRIPVIGWILKGLNALPVYRKQDHPSLMTKNEGTLDAAREALLQGRAITLFPEGRSHSEPSLAELKTGAARIALGAARQGAPVRIIPVGFTYEEKDVFRSEAFVEVGTAIDVRSFLQGTGAEGEAQEKETVRLLTERISGELKAITVNLERWEDLPIIQMAERLYAFRHGEKVGSERLKHWARGLHLFQTEQPERIEQLRSALLSFHRRLALVQASPEDVALTYQPRGVLAFVVKNLAVVCLGLPLFLLGLVLFGVPYLIPRLAARRSELDVQGTVKFLMALVLALVWWPGLVAVFWGVGGWGWGVGALLGVPPLALFTLYFSERWSVLWHDITVFFSLGNRSRLKALLHADGEQLALELERLANEYRARLESPSASASGV